MSGTTRRLIVALNIKVWENQEHPEVTQPPKQITPPTSSLAGDRDLNSKETDRDHIKRTLKNIKRLTKKKRHLDII